MIITPRVIDISHHNVVKDMKRIVYRQRGLTMERVNQLLSYDPSAGTLTWRVRKGHAKAGEMAGHINKANGYVYIGIDGEIYLAHLVVWFLMTGKWPSVEIDHEDLNHANNIWGNLREATPKQNCANRPKRSDSQNPFKGISQKGRKWRAQIVLDGKRRSLGYFSTPEEAGAAYQVAAQAAHGEFARCV